MPSRFLRNLLFAISASVLMAQAPDLQMNVVYVCTDGQSFKVFSCDSTTGACDFQNYKNGQANQRGQALRKQLEVLLPVKCHAQTPVEAVSDPHRGEIPPPAPVVPRPAAGPGSPTASATAGAQTGAGGFKVGDRVRVLSSGWQDATVLQARGSAYLVRLDNGIEVSKGWPVEVRREGKLTAADHAAGQWDLHEKVQVLVNGQWTEGEVVGQSYNRYTIQFAGERTTDAGPENLRPSTAPPPRAPRPVGQIPAAGLSTCAGKYEGRWELSAGMGGMTVLFRSGKATVTEGLSNPMEFECYVGGGKIVLYKAGSYTPFSYGFEINSDGTLQSPLGEIKKKGN